MDQKQATDLGVSIKSKRAIKGGAALEITLEVSYEYLGRAIDRLSATPFAEYIPVVVKVISFLKGLYEDEEIPPPDLGDVRDVEPDPKIKGTGWPIHPKEE